MPLLGQKMCSFSALKGLKMHVQPLIPMFFLYFAQKKASKKFTIPTKNGRIIVANDALGGRFGYAKAPIDGMY